MTRLTPLSWCALHPIPDLDETVLNVLQVNFAPQFVADEGKADVQAVANHINHIANITGRAQCVPTIVAKYTYAHSHTPIVSASAVTTTA